MARFGPNLALSFFFALPLLRAEPPDPPEPTLPSLTCPAGAPLGTVDLRVKSPGNTETLPLQEINRLSEGDTVIYSPVLRGMEKRPGEVALVFVPAKKAANIDSLIVTDLAHANRPHEWVIPQSMKLAAFIYGPQGLSKKKVKGFLSQDDQLVAQLADYAEKTSQTEALLQALGDNAASSASMNAALSGFASQYGLAVQIDKTAPPAAQAQMLFSTMNPQLATYNPIASNSTAERLGQTASIATAAATLFFGSPIGLAAGGTAMLLDLRSIAFPGTQFRSSFAQPALAGVHLCGQRGAVPPHTRIAYIWALRVPNTGSPAIKIGPANFLALGQKADVPVDVNGADWKYVQRARKWMLEDEKGHKTELKVLKVGNEHSLQMELENAKLTAGDYKLTGDWDWTPFQTTGVLHLRPLSDFRSTQLESTSQNALLAHTGKVPVTLRGDDFEFINKVEIERIGDEFATPEAVRFLLPKGPRLGPQESIDVQIDTATLTPGPYKLLITQQDSLSHAVNVKVLAATPRLDNLPILVNQGVSAQHFVLKGERLDLLAKLTAQNATLELGQPLPGGNERDVTVRLAGNVSPGTTISVNAEFTDRSAQLTLLDAVQITGPLPGIASSQLTIPKDLAVTLLPSEFPAGYTLTAVLDVRNVDARSELRLACKDDMGVHATLQIGAQNAVSSLQRISPDQLFLSYDTSGFPAGCSLAASVDNGRAGQSQPFTIARLIRLPKIVSVTLVATAPTANSVPPASATAALAGAPAGLRTFEIKGDNLEMIGQLSWDRNLGVEVSALPSAIPGQGQRQSLLVSLPDAPAADAPLFLWLRGETTARASTAVLAQPMPAAPGNPARAQAISPLIH
jgi:hypothetical protein